MRPVFHLAYDASGSVNVEDMDHGPAEGYVFGVCQVVLQTARQSGGEMEAVSMQKHSGLDPTRKQGSSKVLATGRNFREQAMSRMATPRNGLSQSHEGCSWLQCISNGLRTP